MAEMLRGNDTVAGLKLPEVKKAISSTRRRKPTNETTRAPRWFTLGPTVAELCVTLILWEGYEQDERGIHKSFAELADETGYTKRQLKTARKLAEDEGLLMATPGFRLNAEAQRTLYWRLNWWHLHEVVFESALKETKTALERGSGKRVRDRLNKRRRQLEDALDDLKLRFLDAPSSQEKPEVQPEQEAGEQGVMTRCTHGDNNLTSIHEDTHEVTSVDNELSTPVSAGTEARQIMNGIYDQLKGCGYRLDGKEYAFNLARVRSVLKHDNPTEKELRDLPTACEDFLVWHGTLDVAKALRRMRQQERRSQLEAEEAARRSKRQGSRGGNDWKKHFAIGSRETRYEYDIGDEEDDTP
jgi:hypothetical protein